MSYRRIPVIDKVQQWQCGNMTIPEAYRILVSSHAAFAKRGLSSFHYCKKQFSVVTLLEGLRILPLPSMATSHFAHPSNVSKRMVLVALSFTYRVKKLV